MTILSPYHLRSLRRTRRRYLLLIALVALLFGGWSVFWYYASNRAQHAIERWRAREAHAGRDYTCATQKIGGYPFRIEIDCENPIAEFRGQQPLDVKTERALVAWQIYEPALLIGEFDGPLTIVTPEDGQRTFIANWSSARSSLRGRPKAPERLSLVLNDPSLDSARGDSHIPLLRAKHIEVHGRLAENSTTDQPVVETVLRLEQASIPGLHPLAAEPINADISAVLRGVHDLTPKPWSIRLSELQAGGGINITQARVQQGDILAVGTGILSLTDHGRLDGQLQVTVAGLDQFLEKIGAQQSVQNSRAMNRLAGTLDRLAPGLGQVARERAGANISGGINMIGEQVTLEGRRAVKLLLRFADGLVFLGPIPIGKTPNLF